MICEVLCFKNMAKELPYFQFEPAEYLTGDISFCSLSAQGLFTILCSYYWQRSCKLSKDQFLRRINSPDEFNELVDENVIILNGNDIIIKFLDEQYNKVTKQSKTNSLNGSKGGRPKKQNPNESETKPKQNPNESETKPKQNPNESETKGIREDKIKEDKINDIYNKFVDEVKSNMHDSAIEQMYRNLKIRKGALTPLLEQFKGQLIIDNKVHENTLEFRMHFNNWLNTQDRLGKLQEFKKVKSI